MRAELYFHRGLAYTTHPTYSLAQSQYLMFYDTHNLTAFPGDENTVLLLITDLERRISPQSINVYLAGVHALQISHGYHSPLTNTIRLQQTLRGIERLHVTSVTQKLPITFDLLYRTSSSLDVTNRLDDIVYWAALTTAHFLLLRASEFAVTDSSTSVLHICDVNILFSSTGDKYLALHIRYSKTDQKGQGVTLHTWNSLHAVSVVCAMKSNHHFQHQRSNWTINDPLVRLTSGEAMTRRNRLNLISSPLRLLGVDPQLYSGRSFRIGGATSASVVGLPLPTSTLTRFYPTPRLLFSFYLDNISGQLYCVPIYNIKLLSSGPHSRRQCLVSVMDIK